MNVPSFTCIELWRVLKCHLCFFFAAKFSFLIHLMPLIWVCCLSYLMHLMLLKAHYTRETICSNITTIQSNDGLDWCWCWYNIALELNVLLFSAWFALVPFIAAHCCTSLSSALYSPSAGALVHLSTLHHLAELVIQGSLAPLANTAQG